MKPSSEAHLLSLCFDDGYAASCRAIADAFEAAQMRAAFCVLTAPERAADPFIRAGVIGGFDLWAELAGRGHEVAPHGHVHANLAELSPADAVAEIDDCLAAFEDRLPGFRSEQAIYHCAYNRVTPGALAHLRRRVRAVRATKANAGLNRIGQPLSGGAFDAAFPLPPDVGQDARARIDTWLTSPPSWLVLCFHGVAGEGWGPVPLTTLTALLREVRERGADVLPPGAALDRLEAG